MTIRRKIGSFKSEISMALELSLISSMRSKGRAVERPGSRGFVKYLSMSSMAPKWVVARLCVMAAQLFIRDPCEDQFMAHANIMAGANINLGLSYRRRFKYGC
jgi:hypothetical protein